MPIGEHYDRLLRLPAELNQSIFLFGPRGTGKTSWVIQQFPDAIYIDLLVSATYFDLLANPDRLEKYIPIDCRQWIVIDEVQKIPELLNVVHRLIERYRYRFILTGSSARSLRRKGVNLLGGRAIEYRMHPLTCMELQKDFSLAKALQFGLLPSVYTVSDPKHYLETYLTSYLREEVLQEGLTRNIGEFSRFLEIASFSQGQLLNLSEIAREAAIDRRTVTSYFDIIEDLLLGWKLPIFAKRAKRRTVTHPKFYFFDAGVYRTIRPKGPLDSPEEIDGPVLETLFLEQLRAINDAFRLGYTFYFWRTSNGTEVDFIAYGEKGLIAFEIKRKNRISSSDLSGLKAFSQDYPIAKCYLLYGGKDREYHGKIQVFPFEGALFQLKAILNGEDAS